MDHRSDQADFVKVNGARLYYEAVGKGEALLFLHAGIAHSGMWDEQVAAFAGDYRVIRYDMRGFGRSEPAAGTFAHYEDLRALLDHLGVEHVHLVGCSKGGGVITDFALAHPQRAASLTLVCSAPHGYAYPEDTPEPPEWQELLAAYEAGDLEKAARLETEMWVVGEERRPDEVDAGLLRRVYEMNLIALQKEKQASGEERVLEPKAVTRMDELRIQLLFVIGALDDPVLVAANHTMAEQLRAEKVVIEDTAHLPSMEKPAVFNRHLRDFLRRQR